MNSKYYKNVLKKRIGYLVLLVCVIAIGAIPVSYTHLQWSQNGEMAMCKILHL